MTQYHHRLEYKALSYVGTYAHIGHVYTLKSNIQLEDVILKLSASTATLQVLLTQEQLPGSEKAAALLLPHPLPTPTGK